MGAPWRTTSEAAVASARNADATAATHALMNDGFVACVEHLQGLVRDKGYALSDLLTEVSERVMCTQFPPDAMSALLEQLADLEYRLATGTNEQLQLTSFVSAFTLARQQMGAAAGGRGRGPR